MHEGARVEASGPMSATLPATLPLTLLTGFLGSGKTSFLRRALSDRAFADTAVVVNEIGEIAIDHHLVDFVEGDVVELPGGCLCCAMREDLARTLRGLIDRRDGGALRPFRRIVVETTGLADPAPILFTLGADPMLDYRLRLARVVTIVDASTGAETLGRFPEAARQAALADVLVISKTDLAPAALELAPRLDELNPRAHRFLGAVAEPGEVLFGGAFGARSLAWPRVGEAGIGGDPANIAEGDHAAHSHGIDVFAIALSGPITRLQFAHTLGALAQARGNDLLRVKGIVCFADRPEGPAVVQAAQHALFAPEWLDDWPDEDRRNRLVFIVHDISREEILSRFAFAEGRPLGGSTATAAASIQRAVSE